MKAAISFGITIGLLAAFAVYAGLSKSSATVGQTLPFEKGVFLTAGRVAVGPDASLLRDLPQVGSVKDLESRLRPGVTTIVIDADTIDQLPPGFLSGQLRAGRSIIGINVPLSVLVTKSDLAQRQDEGLRGPDGQLPRQVPDLSKLLNVPVPTEEYFSFLSTTPAGSSTFRAHAGQKPFSSGTFSSNLALHLNGNNSDIGLSP